MSELDFNPNKEKFFRANEVYIFGSYTSYNPRQ